MVMRLLDDIIMWLKTLVASITPLKYRGALLKWIDVSRGQKQKTLAALYESKNFIFVNKDFDLLINSDDNNVTDSVAIYMCKLRPDLVDSTIAHGFRFAHRLDYATSGVLCLALNKKAARWAHRAFLRHEVIKHYLALVYGHVTHADDGTVINIDLPIGKDREARKLGIMKMTAKSSAEDSKSASTDMVVLEHGLYNGQPASKLLLIPRTGRTHQLRVHCLHLGHRIIGDYMYSEGTDVTNHRMMLHSYRLCLPLAQEHLDVTAPDPFTHTLDLSWTPLMVYQTYEMAVRDYYKDDVPHMRRMDSQT